MGTRRTNKRASKSNSVNLHFASRRPVSIIIAASAGSNQCPRLHVVCATSPPHRLVCCTAIRSALMGPRLGHSTPTRPDLPRATVADTNHPSTAAAAFACATQPSKKSPSAADCASARACLCVAACCCCCCCCRQTAYSSSGHLAASSHRSQTVPSSLNAL
ncbi:hypothetical protein IWZ03DRAFT_378228 [Phyllosticta citriasiana]|uniref:Uncharacterized protein n=1 Tax=Phyllosticta citriasiana TaxID=595635 RepID=A0ABR1KKY5_9PEZI